jgi:phenylalanyl-tRNA synthetase beta chain
LPIADFGLRIVIRKGKSAIGNSQSAIVMKVPLKWLSDYVGRNVSVAELLERLTLAGLEVAGVRVLGLPVPDGLRLKPDDAGPVWDPKKLVIGQVRNVEKHPNADKLLLVTLDYGTGLPKTVVTGAPNLKVGDHGMKVVLGLSGMKYFPHAHGKDKKPVEKKLVELQPKDMRGIPNDAMVCSAWELGISDEEEDGIILLQDDAPLGKPLVEYMGDIVVELEVTPNLAHCLSIIGVAREVAALTGGRLSRKFIDIALKTSNEPIGEQVKVQIEDPKLSRRYMAALIKGVKIGPAPSWMQWRLTYAGMRPITNIVDITNYIMLEWGQPLHAFDYDVLKQRAGGQAPTIIVRRARAGEKLVTIDKVERALLPDHLVIADTAGPIALAGVMGGLETEVSEKTTNVLLESASFDKISIRRTMKHFNLPSEASTRFSRGVHPEIVKPAAEQAANLMAQFANGAVCKGMVDCYPAPLEPKKIILESQEVQRLLGINLGDREIKQTLDALEFQVKPDAPGTLLVQVPPYRLDVDGSADLIEELARIHGYDRLPATMLADPLPAQHGNRSLTLEERTRDILVAAGLQEVITYSLTMPKREAPLGERGPYVSLKNPISPERSVMRRTLLAGALEVTRDNLRHTSDVRLFEAGAVYLPKEGQRLPDEPRRLALVMTGRRGAEFWEEGPQAVSPPLDFFDLKGIIESLVAELHLPEVSYRAAQVPWLHPARAAELLIQGKPAGAFGQLHPQVTEAFDMDSSRGLLVAELDLEAILATVPERFLYRPVPIFPPALRDIAVIVAEAVSVERVVAEIRQGGGELLRDVRLFDVYRGGTIPAGTKSLAFALSYQAGDRTLAEREVNDTHKKIEGRLRHVLDATIRGEEAKK